MLTLHSKSQRYCDGIDRRNFLKIGTIGIGQTLADVLSTKPMATKAGQAPSSGVPTHPGAARPKSVILIYLVGGPAHMDMFDLKPDSSAEFRSNYTSFPLHVFGEPGVRFAEYYLKREGQSQKEQKNEPCEEWLCIGVDCDPCPPACPGLNLGAMKIFRPADFSLQDLMNDLFRQGWNDVALWQVAHRHPAWDEIVKKKAYQFIRHYDVKGMEATDLIHNAWLWASTEFQNGFPYSPENGAIEPYLGRIAWNMCVRTMEREWRHQNRRAHSAEVHNLPSRSAQTRWEEIDRLAKQLERAWQRLDRYETAIITMLREGFNQTKIAQELGFSKMWVTHKMNGIRRKLSES